MPDPRHQGHGGPERVPSFGHQFAELHERVVSDASRDESFYSGIPHTAKVDFICEVMGMPRAHFNIDLPVPLEDWSVSDDRSLAIAGLYMAALRNAFYAKLLDEQPELRHGAGWVNHAEAEYWNHAFNVVIHRRNNGVLLGDPRTLQ